MSRMNSVDLYLLHKQIAKEMKIVLGSIQAVIYAKNEAEVNNENQEEWINHMRSKMKERINILNTLLSRV